MSCSLLYIQEYHRTCDGKMINGQNPVRGVIESTTRSIISAAEPEP